MRLQLILAITVAVLGTAVASNLAGYEGYNKYTVFHDKDNAFQYMVDLQSQDVDLDFWLLSRNMSIVSVSPVMIPIFEERLNELGVTYQAVPLMEVMRSFNETLSSCEGSDCEHSRTRRQARGFFSHFPRYPEILAFMNGLASRYPQFCRYESLGRSSEGRHLAALSISLNSRTRPRRVAYIQAGVHGREWITPMSVLYFANELLSNIRAFQKVLNDVEVYLLPLANPDGYEYTFTTDRFWRKNRHRYPGRSCVGVDINRNFANNWNLRGASQNLCSEVFSGTSPASEPETSAITRYLEYNRHRVKLSLDVHSFGKFIFYPYGYSRNANAPTRNFLHQVALRAGSQIAKYRGTVYTVGTSANILYEAAGGLDDFAYGNLGIPMSFTLELPGENFQVASSDIIHICKETFAGFVEFIRHVSLF
ncbi:carboxypeptidase B [Musca vetustissima]|uniref:carboxypeptidase B-like n=1 Tax=Musca vetustissima TaxID=27455 RepID=UPI002AB7A5A4|nr:carboxypeptidase B-like [Musca vetustissima]XP_061395614.1 carboxypeptidase B [Musca vetustissima]